MINEYKRKKRKIKILKKMVKILLANDGHEDSRTLIADVADRAKVNKQCVCGCLSLLKRKNEIYITRYPGIVYLL